MALQMLTTLAIGLTLVALCLYALDMRAAYLRPMRRSYVGVNTEHREYGYDPYDTQRAYSPYLHVDRAVLEDLERTQDMESLTQQPWTQADQDRPVLTARQMSDSWLTGFSMWLERDHI